MTVWSCVSIGTVSASYDINDIVNCNIAFVRSRCPKAGATGHFWLYDTIGIWENVMLTASSMAPLHLYGQDS